ncbi:MAG: hypothetical protein PHI35_02170 [Victivallaceae bacterium]|nr:hypothetical protein [Victivallaceae bacterium]
MLNIQRRMLLEPRNGSLWASKMVLNPAMTADPDDPDHIVMLFRATGPWPQAQIPGKPLPFPIFLGFGESLDGGNRWAFDFSRPAMAPRLEYDRDRFLEQSCRNGRLFDYANGCIEDPRFLRFEDGLYLSVACRAFPPGPYWDHDEPTQCLPDWVMHTSGLGRAFSENHTVTLLYKVDFDALVKKQFDAAFSLIVPLHEPDRSDDRDAFFFPRRLKIDGRDRIVVLHRPKEPGKYQAGKACSAPSIFMACGDKWADFGDGTAEEAVFATGVHPWELDRIGASFQPIELGNGEWLLPYHGKQDERIGYTQSFMLLRERPSGLPEIVARPAGRLFHAEEKWELEGDFATPCVFSCSGIVRPDGRLLMGYGAADSRVGLASVDLAGLVAFLRSSAAPQN